MTKPADLSTRYGVEIKAPTLHMECDKLEQVLTLLEGHTGVVRVFDRNSHELVVDGTVQDARKVLGEIVGPRQVTESQVAQRPTDGQAGDDATRPGDAPSYGMQTYEVQISGGLSIASAYYFGDLSSVTRKRDSNGEAMYIRSMFTRLRPQAKVS